MKKRMEMIAGYCPRCGCAADIGCDHGIVAAALIERGICEKVIATDISADSLKKARLLAEEHGIDDMMDFRAGDGLTVVGEGETNAIIIAGMGADLIAEILEKGSKTAKSADVLILVPHTHPERLRLYLSENGFRITNESCIEEDGKYYNVMRAERGTPDIYSEEELLFGKRELYDEGYATRLSHERKICEKIAGEMEKNGKDASLVKHRLEIIDREAAL